MIIIKHTDPSPSTIDQLAALTAHNDWKMVFLNHAVVIYVKNSPGNKGVIAAHLITEKNFTPTSSELTDKESIRAYSNFFRAIGWDQQWLEMNLHFIKFDPTNCAALQNIAFIYQKHHAPQTQSAINTFIQTCVH